jgi:hypothetical protein
MSGGESSKRGLGEWLLVWSSLLVLCVLLGAWFLVFRAAGPGLSEPFSPGLHGNDFKHIYLGAWMLDKGENPYDAQELFRTARLRGFTSLNPYVYLPFTGLVLAPLTRLGPGDALRLWFVLNHLFFIAALALIFLSILPKPGVADIACVLLLGAFSYPLQVTLTAGQLNCALLLCFSLVFVLMRWRRPWLAGAVAAFAFLFKLMPGVLFVYFIWAGIRWTKRLSFDRLYLKALISMILLSVLLTGWSVWRVGWPMHEAFRPLLSDMAYGKSTWAEYGNSFYRDPPNQSLNSFFHHVASPWKNFRPWVELGADWANRLTRLAVILCAAILFWRSRPRPDRRTDGNPKPVEGRDEAILFGLFMVLALLIPSICWDHYLVMLVWPLTACWRRIPEKTRAFTLGLTLLFIFAIGALVDAEFIWWRYGLGGAENMTTGALAGRVLKLLLGTLVFVKALILAAAGWRYADKRAWGIATLWALSAALVMVRLPWSRPSWHDGLGLLAMSTGLWGTLLLFALSLKLLRTPGVERD